LSKSVSSGYGGIKNQHLKQENMKKEIKDRLDRWLSENYEYLSTEISTKIAKNKMSEYSDDLLSHMILFIYTQPDEKIEQMLEDDKLGWYMLTGAGMQLRSSTSPFYLKYRKNKMGSRSGIMENYDEGYEIDNPDETMDLWECYQLSLNELSWYSRTLLEKKLQDRMSYDEMYKYYEISKTHLVRDVNDSLQQIREFCKDVTK
jgi:hypothetical protein